MRPVPVRCQDRLDPILLDQGLEPGAISGEHTSRGHAGDRGCDATQVFRADRGVEGARRQVLGISDRDRNATAGIAGTRDPVGRDAGLKRDLAARAEGGEQVCEPWVWDPRGLLADLALEAKALGARVARGLAAAGNDFEADQAGVGGADRAGKAHASVRHQGTVAPTDSAGRLLHDGTTRCNPLPTGTRSARSAWAKFGIGQSPNR